MARRQKLGDQFRDIKKKNERTVIRPIVVKTFADLSRAIVFDTAVDEGRARGNWVPGFGGINFEQGQIDRAGGATAARIAQELDGRFALGEDFFMTNTLPYIGVLEYGGYPGVGPKTTDTGQGIFPIQADEGMVRVNIARFRPTVERIAQELAR